MKYVVVILDGAAGWPLDALDGKSTLEAAHTPNLDALACEGMVGLARTVPEGEEPSSSAACTSILGYDPVADYVGRGAIEAASMGIELADDEIALRVNLVNIEDGIMKSYSCGHIPTPQSRVIVRGLGSAFDDDTFTLYPGVSYRHILVVKGHPELLDASYTPPHDISDQPVAEFLPKGPGSELLLSYMEDARDLLPAIPANIRRAGQGDVPATDVWPFWPGAAPKGMTSFAEKRGVTAALTSGVDLLNGLAVLAGIDRLEIEGITGGSDNDYRGQAQGALDALADHDLVVIHVEAPDEEGHAGSVEGKVAAIEAIDREVVSVVREYGGDLRILAMPDHPTPIKIKTHVGEPVPFILWGAGIEPNGAESYSEKAAAATGLLLDPGLQVMDKLLAP